jgi:hypothetical protein
MGLGSHLAAVAGREGEMRKLARFGLAVLSWVASGCLALAAAPSGAAQAVGIDPSALANYNNISRTLFVGANVSMGETVVTGPAGKVQLVFSDQTKLLIGPNSSLLIEAYLLRPDNTATQFAVDALSGSFRFITGNSAKNAYRIDTPTGMIGVRGTQFDFTVDPAKGTSLVLFEGAVRMCNLDNKCLDLAQGCAVGMMTATGSAAVAPAQQPALKGHFPFVGEQTGLLPAFQVADSNKCLTAPAASPGKAAPVKAKPTGTPRPPSGSGQRPPVRAVNPCLDYDLMSDAERLALRRNHIVCRGSRPPRDLNYDPFGDNGSLIGNPFEMQMRGHNNNY